MLKSEELSVHKPLGLANIAVLHADYLVAPKIGEIYATNFDIVCFEAWDYAS
jgi:hypothetical protein